MATVVFVSFWRGCCGPSRTDDLSLASQTACFCRGTPSKGLSCCWADYHKKSMHLALNYITKIFIQILLYVIYDATGYMCMMGLEIVNWFPLEDYLNRCLLFYERISLLRWTVIIQAHQVQFFLIVEEIMDNHYQAENNAITSRDLCVKETHKKKKNVPLCNAVKRSHG